MPKNKIELLEGIKDRKTKIEEHLQHLQEIKKTIDAFKTGNIDAVVISDKNRLKIYTEQEADKTYRILIEKMNEGAVTLNEDAIIIYCNSYFANMVNFPLQKVPGTIFKNFIDDSLKKRFVSLLKQARQKAIKEEVYLHTSKGKAIPVLMSVNTFLMDNIFVSSIILTDLTIQNQNKEALNRRTRELQQKNIELESVNNELAFQNKEKEKQAAKLIIANKELEQFAYIASHDLQEPLRTVSNYMQVFEQDYVEQLDDKARKYLHSVNNATKRMKILIKSLLNFSRLGRNTKLAYVGFKELVDNVIADLDGIIKASKAIIEVGEMPHLNVYETEISQVFRNLISNAIKFQEQDNQPKIQIRSEKINEKWQFSVADNGIGIAAVHFERIFNIFQRLHTNEEYEGSGIGLANCKKIVHLHQGEIWIKSNPGKSTTFYFTLSNLKIE